MPELPVLLNLNKHFYCNLVLPKKCNSAGSEQNWWHELNPRHTWSYTCSAENDPTVISCQRKNAQNTTPLLKMFLTLGSWRSGATCVIQWSIRLCRQDCKLLLGSKAVRRIQIWTFWTFPLKDLQSIGDGHPRQLGTAMIY